MHQKSTCTPFAAAHRIAFIHSSRASIPLALLPARSESRMQALPIAASARRDGSRGGGRGGTHVVDARRAETFRVSLAAM